MISKNDCLIMLYDIKNKGISTDLAIKELLENNGPTVNVIAFINDNRPLELKAFYEKLRKSYNQKKSNLYINICKSDEQEPKDILVTLSSLLTQIFLFAKTLDNSEMFVKHSRANEITKVINNYLKDYNLTNCVKLLQLVKADMKILESIGQAH